MMLYMLGYVSTTAGVLVPVAMPEEGNGGDDDSPHRIQIPIPQDQTATLQNMIGVRYGHDVYPPPPPYPPPPRTQEEDDNSLENSPQETAQYYPQMSSQAPMKFFQPAVPMQGDENRKQLDGGSGYYSIPFLLPPSSVTAVPQGVSMYPQTQGVSVYPQTQGVSVYPQTQGVSVYPQTQGVSVHPQTQGVSVHPQTQGVSVYPQTQGVSVYPQTQGSSVYPQTQGSSVYPQTQGSSVYPQTQGEFVYPQPQGGFVYPQPQGGFVYPQPQGGFVYPQPQGGFVYPQPQGGFLPTAGGHQPVQETRPPAPIYEDVGPDTPPDGANGVGTGLQRYAVAGVRLQLRRPVMTTAQAVIPRPQQEGVATPPPPNTVQQGLRLAFLSKLRNPWSDGLAQVASHTVLGPEGAALAGLGLGLNLGPNRHITQYHHLQGLLNKHFGKYTPHGHGLYGFSASNNVHNSNAFGLYKYENRL